MNYEKSGNNIILKNIKSFNLENSLDCGQAFRWKKDENNIWSGIYKKSFLKIKQENEKIIFYNTNEDEFNNIWKKYFDLERDYEAVLKSYDDKYLIEAVKKYDGIRILKQDEWEAICSFIISQNNNIPRIKGIIERLCENFGEKTEGGYTFPSFEVLADLKPSDLEVLRAGFRNKYIIDAAEKISSGEVDLEKIKSLPFAEGKAELLKIKGVGEKVAQCSLLYGFGKLEAFPEDVWVKRIISELYPDGLPECIKGTEGIAQQYLFHWRRNLVELNKKD